MSQPVSRRSHHVQSVHNKTKCCFPLVEIIYGVAYSILSAIVLVISWRLWLAMGGILWLVFLVPTILAVIGIINAVYGKMKSLPVIGGITILK